MLPQWEGETDQISWTTYKCKNAWILQTLIIFLFPLNGYIHNKGPTAWPGTTLTNHINCFGCASANAAVTTYSGPKYNKTHTQYYGICYSHKHINSHLSSYEGQQHKERSWWRQLVCLSVTFERGHSFNILYVSDRVLFLALVSAVTSQQESRFPAWSGRLCLELACSPCVCMGSLSVVQQSKNTDGVRLIGHSILCVHGLSPYIGPAINRWLVQG